jgi:hypothetical protein
VLITPSTWGSQLTGYNHHHQLHTSHQVFSSTVAGEEKEDFCKGSFRMHILYFVLLFCFTLLIFICIVLSKTQKN